jgi:hypothetical protein
MSLWLAGYPKAPRFNARFRVKTGNALIEHSTSGLPPKTRHPRFDKRLGSTYHSGRSRHTRRRRQCGTRRRKIGHNKTAAVARLSHEKFREILIGEEVAMAQKLDIAFWNYDRTRLLARRRPGRDRHRAGNVLPGNARCHKTTGCPALISKDLSQ